MASTAAPVSASPHPARLPDLVVTSATFDRDRYAVGDTARVRITFTNVGRAKARDVRLSGGPAGEPTDLEITDWGGIERGFSVPVGATRRFVVTGTVPAGALTYGGVAFGYSFRAANGEADDSDNIASARAFVPGGIGGVEGHFFGDLDGDLIMDPGEELGGVRVTAAGRNGVDHRAQTTTGEDGSFRLDGLPVGEYEVRFDPSAEWQPKVTTAQVIADQVSRLYVGTEPAS
ncbi:MAG TPA: carboxypeptidase-like regulatory domain-containing protein [Spirillospora sp.]